MKNKERNKKGIGQLHCYYHRLLCHSLHRPVILLGIVEEQENTEKSW